VGVWILHGPVLMKVAAEELSKVWITFRSPDHPGIVDGWVATHPAL